jgi:hypothetical protein
MLNPRLTIVLDRELRRDLWLAAKKRGKSLSAIAAELLRDALERDEDIFLCRLAEHREKTTKRIYSHDEVWKGQLG